MAVQSFGCDDIPKNHLEDISSDRSLNVGAMDKIREEIT